MRPKGASACKLSPNEGVASYQLVGEVRLTKAMTRSGSERTIRHIGTEIRPRLLREAAVGNIAQWSKD